MTETVSQIYTLSFLAVHPKTKDIVAKHLSPLGVDEQQILAVHETLSVLYDTNMGGGIPPDILVALMAELDALQSLSD